MKPKTRSRIIIESKTRTRDQKSSFLPHSLVCLMLVCLHHSSSFVCYCSHISSIYHLQNGTTELSTSVVIHGDHTCNSHGENPQAHACTLMLLLLSEYKFSTADNKSCVNQSIVFIYIKLFNSCLYIILSI